MTARMKSNQRDLLHDLERRLSVPHLIHHDPETRAHNSMSFFAAASPTPGLHKEIESIPRETLVIELRRATQHVKFYTLSDRIRNESRVARLVLRLQDQTQLDPRAQTMIAAFEARSPGKTIEAKAKVLTLTPDELEELYFVFENIGFERVSEILLAAYPLTL
jgi:hypothetical protein